MCFMCGEERDGFCRVLPTCVSVQAVPKIHAKAKIDQVIQSNSQSLVFMGNLFSIQYKKASEVFLIVFAVG